MGTCGGTRHFHKISARSPDPAQIRSREQHEILRWQSKYPLVERDLVGIVDHIVEFTQGDFDVAARRLNESGDLLHDIAATPISGMRITGALDGWLVRHGGQSHRLTIVFHADVARDVLQIALVAFGGQDWAES